MRKHIFTTILLASSLLLPTFASYSCSSLNDYQVTKAEFEKIITLEDVQFMQIDEKTYDQSGALIELRNDRFSPSVYHFKASFISENYYKERYVKKDPVTDEYTKIERTDPEGSWGEWYYATEGDFSTIKEFSIQLVDIYQIALASSDFTFDNEKKCYAAWSIENEDGDKDGVEFYFYKKQLIKVNMFKNDVLKSEISLTYLNDQPEPPIPPIL